MSKKKKTKDWANKRGRDIYYKESKIQGYRSRAAFKLLDLNKKFRFLNNSTNVLDITNTTVLGFFDEHLKSNNSNWKNDLSKKLNTTIKEFQNDK